MKKILIILFVFQSSLLFCQEGCSLFPKKIIASKHKFSVTNYTSFGLQGLYFFNTKPYERLIDQHYSANIGVNSQITRRQVLFARYGLSYSNRLAKYYFYSDMLKVGYEYYFRAGFDGFGVGTSIDLMDVLGENLVPSVNLLYAKHDRNFFDQAHFGVSYLQNQFTFNIGLTVGTRVFR
jgi:hypothetical protein